MLRTALRTAMGRLPCTIRIWNNSSVVAPQKDNRALGRADCSPNKLTSRCRNTTRTARLIQ